MSEAITTTDTTLAQETDAVKLDPIKFADFLQQVHRQQNLLMGAFAGLIAAVIAALIWAGITAATNFQIGWMAVGVGFLVGFALRAVGKGVTPIFGVTGAALALLGCLAGNVLTVALVLARQEGIPFVDLAFFFLTTPPAALEAVKATFGPIDLLFYGIALYQGYKLSFRRITEDEIAQLVQS